MTEDLIADLARLNDSFVRDGVNTNERAEMLINSAIQAGLENGKDIVKVLVKLGFHPRHAGMMLRGGIEMEPTWPFWGRRDDGTYFAPDVPE